MSQAKERPILFSGPMVRAVLSEQKTVTRRPIKPSKRGFDVSFELHQQEDGSWRPMHTFDESCMDNHGTEHPVVCPYGQPGDRLWARESLGYDCECGHYFAAGGKHGEMVYLSELFDDDKAQTGYSYDGLLPERSVPSIHLHRRYSRILLEITDVRVERLRDADDMTLLDDLGDELDDCDSVAGREFSRMECMQVAGASLKMIPEMYGFKARWDKTNGPGSFDSNPWVWVVEFKRVQP